jgi:hypothetical protein
MLGPRPILSLHDADLAYSLEEIDRIIERKLGWTSPPALTRTRVASRNGRAESYGDAHTDEPTFNGLVRRTLLPGLSDTQASRAVARRI